VLADGYDETVERAFTQKVSLTCLKQNPKIARELCEVEWLLCVALEIEMFLSICILKTKNFPSKRKIYLRLDSSRSRNPLQFQVSVSLAKSAFNRKVKDLS